MKKRWLVLIILVTIGVAGVAYADIFQNSASCSKPYKPYEFSNEWEYQNFLNDVERYKKCIADFVQDQRDQAQSHLDAADEAIKEWNSYVRSEL